MIELDEHKVNAANDVIGVRATDKPGAGGAYHRYEISGVDFLNNDSMPLSFSEDTSMMILFQNGPIPDKGTNGVTHEALLAITAHRLRCFQDGSYACRENAMALQHIEEAMNWLNRRTLSRMRRGVEGTHTV